MTNFMKDGSFWEAAVGQTPTDLYAAAKYNSACRTATNICNI